MRKNVCPTTGFEKLLVATDGSEFSAAAVQEAINIAALLQTHHWQSALVVSDLPHMRRLDYSLQPVFEKAGLHYRLIQSYAPTWHADRWWQDEKWAQFCVMEVVKLVYYGLVYRNEG